MSDKKRQATTAPEPMVSVVIPTRDRRGALERCLKALAAQTHSSFEVIVVDDCSSDGTLEFLQQFANGHPGLKLRWLSNETHIGANRSRNRGIRDAGGEFIAFIDSDCVADSDWLVRLVRGFTGERVAAVTGLVRDPAPSNVWELSFKGTHRVPRAGPANRLVGGNMCIRRSLLLKRPLDEDLRWGCDEEGIFLWLRAAGYEQRVVPDAIVLHEHPYTLGSFFRQAYAGGGATARLVYKYHLPPRLDLLPFMLAYLSLPLILVDLSLGVVFAFFFFAALAAITYNDLFRKRKTIGETLCTFPVLLAYYQVRLVGYAVQALALRLGRNAIKRERVGRA